MLVLRLRAKVLRLPAAAVCALATHALLYRTPWPADGAHGYFGWYEPVVAVVSLASLAGLLGFVAVAWAARRSGRPLGVPAPLQRPDDVAASARSLGVSAFAFLLIQESLERSLEAGHPALQAFTPSEYLVLLAGLAATSLVLAGGLRLAKAVVGRVLGAPPAARRPDERVVPGWSVVTCRPRRSRPLAERFALRAPPSFPS
jgi:hypothetical protein